MNYENMTDAEIVDHLRQMTGLDHVGSMAHVAANRIEELKAAHDERLKELRAECDEAEKMAAAHEAKWQSICKCPDIGTCACSYEDKEHVCMHHAPKLAEAVAERDQLRSRVEELEEVGKSFVGCGFVSQSAWDTAKWLTRNCAALQYLVEGRAAVVPLTYDDAYMGEVPLLDLHYGTEDEDELSAPVDKFRLDKPVEDK